MQKPFEIKGIMIGEGKPVVCVPVVAPSEEEIVAKVAELAKRQVQMIEWRVDQFDGVSQPERVSAVLEMIRPLVEHVVFLFTFRSLKQGGNLAMPEKQILYLNEIAAKSGTVDMIDLEFFEATRPEREIRRFQKMGVKIIASHHDFDGTPQDSILHILMDQMQQGGADVAKLAVMPKNMDDVIRILKLTNDTKEKYPTLPVVTMSMSGLGAISRVVGEAVGSCITFGADGAVSAPGQLPLGDLTLALDVIHRAM